MPAPLVVVNGSVFAPRNWIKPIIREIAAVDTPKVVDGGELVARRSWRHL